MANVNISKSENIRNDDSIVIREQTNPSFHDTPEDGKNYKSLQNKPQIKGRSMFTLKPSLLTQKAEQLRTDKAAVNATTAITNSTPCNRFLVLSENAKDFSSVSSTPIDKKEITNKSSSFIFGENIFSRVVKPDDSSANTTGGGGHSGATGEEESSSSAKEFKDLISASNTAQSSSSTEAGNDALRKSADELSQKQSLGGQQFDEAEVITGEEADTTALKALCKLFLFNSERNEWVEKGFCNVHLNDMTDESSACAGVAKSRLVVRSKGGLKVLVNTLLWPDMALERASAKAVRISAQSEDGVRSFLLHMQNATDANQLFDALHYRKSRLTIRATSGPMKKTSPTFNNNNRKRELLDSDDSEDACQDPKKPNWDTSDNGNTDDGSSDC